MQFWQSGGHNDKRKTAWKKIKDVVKGILKVMDVVKEMAKVHRWKRRRCNRRFHL